MRGSDHTCGAKQWFRCWAPGAPTTVWTYKAHLARHVGHIGYITDPTRTASPGTSSHPGNPAHLVM